jgi:hypothetical protein
MPRNTPLNREADAGDDRNWRSAKGSPLQHPFSASEFTAYAVKVYPGKGAMFMKRWKLDNCHRHFVLQAEQFGAS